MAGSRRSPFHGIILVYVGMDGEVTKNPHSGQPLSRPDFEAGSPRIHIIKTLLPDQTLGSARYVYSNYVTTDSLT